ncbi:MAG: DUF2141 domain-containing protein [Sphingorhabdus sp.]
MSKAYVLLAVAGWALASSAAAAGQEVSNDLARCAEGKGPSVLVHVRGVKEAAGRIRVQSYPATSGAWLAKGRWLHRVESRANTGSMSFCVPVPAAGKYGIAVRHDRNANGKTDISKDGGGFSNNPGINILNLGKPSVSKVAFYAGTGVTKITINLQYM